ncbi:MAG: cyclic nucleotide-binding/CBS domain-containing protein [Candidatus Nitrosocosmicus sp.]
MSKDIRDETTGMTTRVLVSDVMNSPIVHAGPNDDLVAISKLMTNAKIGSIIVLDNDKPLGIITDWDIVTKAIANGSIPSEIKASSIMQPLITISGEESITSAARLLRQHGIKRLGVTHKDHLVGIISVSDVLAVTPELFDVVSEKSLIIRGEIGRSPRNISGYCDECGEWSDFLLYADGSYTCEVCRGE